MKEFKYFIGIDVSKDNFVVSCKNEKFIFENKKFNMDNDGLQLASSILKNFKEESIIGIEATGIYHFNLVDFLNNQKYNVSMVNPYKVKQFFKFASTKPTKTDKIDSKIISNYLQFTNQQPQSSPIDEKQQIKYLVREKEYITNQIAQIKTEIKRVLCIVWPEIERKFDIIPDTILSILKIFPSAHKIRNICFEKFNEKVNDVFKRKGRKVKIDLSEIYNLAKNSISSFWPFYENLLKTKIQQLHFMQKQLIKINKQIKNFAYKYYKREINILTSIKGIGVNSAIYFICEIQDIKRFQNYKKLIGYCGLDPVIHQSGKYKGKWKISKKGNAHTRRIVYLMAESVRKNVPMFKNYYIKKRNEGKTHTQAVIATSTKLLKLIYTLLSENRLFN